MMIIVLNNSYRDFSKRVGSAETLSLGGRPRSLESPEDGQVIDAMNILAEERQGRNTLGAGM